MASSNVLENISINLRDDSAILAVPTEDMYNPIPDNVILPSVTSFMDGLSKYCPNACALDTYRERDIISEQNTEIVIHKIPLKVLTPMDKITQYFEESEMECESCETCFDTIINNVIRYNDNEITEIERLTRGQHENQNWHAMRRGLLTASNVKMIYSSINMDKTSERLLDGNHFDDQNAPLPIQFGRKNEQKAVNMFMKTHKFEHRKCSNRNTGLYISRSAPYIGASPDSLVNCNKCGEFLIEVKCLYKYRNFHPASALVHSGICEKTDQNTLIIKVSHPYYFQIQAQMFVTNIHKCLLVGYTLKGIKTVEILFNPDFWAECMTRLTRFYRYHFIPMIKESVVA